MTLVCACVQIMDTPLPGQIRPIQQEAGRATEADVMELVEMILGALGRDALGLGSSIAHPRESEEWKSMTPHQKLEFFAPIWRIMRDENMTVEQVSFHILWCFAMHQTGFTQAEMHVALKKCRLRQVLLSKIHRVSEYCSSAFAFAAAAAAAAATAHASVAIPVSQFDQATPVN